MIVHSCGYDLIFVLFSVTELELLNGILTATKPELHTSVYQRILRGLNGDNITDDTAKRYFDTVMKNGKVQNSLF